MGTIIGLALVLVTGLVAGLGAAETAEGESAKRALDGSGADSADYSIDAELVADGLHHPWALALLPDGDFLVTERRGRLYLVSRDGADRQRIEGLPRVAASGQGGLLDIVLHPDYGENGWVYFTYSRPAESGGSTTAAARARLDVSKAEGSRLTDLEELFAAEPPRSGGQHFGSRLAFDRDGYLYITLGERGQRDQAQDPSNHWGSTVRLHDDGSVPGDNPFVDSDDHRPELFTIGHRNPQGIVRHPETGAIWLHEHGPRGGDELNLLTPGANYGWPRISHGDHYSGAQVGVGSSAPGMEQPVAYWVPSIAPSGMAYMDDSFFIGALAGQHLRRVVMDGREVVRQDVLLENELGRIRDVRAAGDGVLYLLTDAANGGLYRVELN